MGAARLSGPPARFLDIERTEGSNNKCRMASLVPAVTSVSKAGRR